MHRQEYLQIVKLKKICQCGEIAEAVLNGVPHCDPCFRRLKPKGRRRGSGNRITILLGK